MNDYRQRLSRLEKYLTLDPDNPALLMDCLQTAQGAGNAEAVSDYQDQLVAIRTKLPAESRYALVYSLVQAKRLGDAERVLATEPEEGHGAIHAQLKAATALLRNNAAAALEALNAVNLPDVEMNTVRNELTLLKAKTLHHLGRLLEAERLLSDMTGVEAALEGTRQAELALVYLDLGKQEEAASALEHADDTHLEAKLTRAYLSLADGTIDTVPSLLSTVLKQAPDDQRALLGMAMYHMSSAEPQEAIDYLERCVGVHPEGLAPRNAMAWCLLSQGDIEGAEACWKEAIEVDRTFAELHGGLAVIAVLRNEDDQYRDFLRKALGLDPNCFSAWFASFLFEAHSGNERKANRILSGLLSRDLGGKSLAQSLAERVPAFQ